MMTVEALTTFFGWCSIINIAVMLLSTLAITLFRAPVVRIHSRTFQVNPDDLPMLYFNYLANYKIAIYMFNIVPYIALKIMV